MKREPRFYNTDVLELTWKDIILLIRGKTINGIGIAVRLGGERK